MSAVASRCFLRSAASRTVSFAAGGKSRPTRSPFRVPTQSSLSNRIFRSPPPAMSCCVESMQPYHMATASALLTSMLSACPRSYGWTHEGQQKTR
ncbi:protein NUCLEAR FUSION DEFECTIVE 6, chloroplastic/mitochondrial-like isoform X2 [Arachis ipaensis]|uniref:protein NUCLEAR FUSION DEFECTIVE 6, chloroplastic/mitochondrial-like isoform X2 n=1 Tax=Arachis ipaensis TaxID=130454 RepID=UPI0007AF0591|nr:protein NUCLEAR FUSION DEFECTIVE 6, chloroplastic/mitochondrial-like isoform X2 [Arachis ipaensis]XP_025638299.1 protein NUCLEAR FUSION DEFECTIVE 6, chloroplastic/mitochondrial isoform X1 [Arachis hypogaea]